MSADSSLAPWHKSYLQRALSIPAHAVLLHGPSGLGQFRLAFEVAKAWLCEAPDLSPGHAACGVCSSCLQADAGAHADLFVLMPEALKLQQGLALDERSQKEIDEKKRKPSQDIRIEAVRAAIDFTGLTSGRGRAKVVLIYPAHAMTHPAANALLKVLEEPHGNTRFVLSTEAADQLLPTIRSRCQSVAISYPAAQDARKWLRECLPALGADECDGVLRASGGRPEDSLALVKSGVHAVWAQFPNAVAADDVAVTKSFSVPTLIESMLKLCHDLWALKLGAEPRFFLASDLPRPPSARNLAQWQHALLASAKMMHHPVRSELFVENLMTQARLCLHSKP